MNVCPHCGVIRTGHNTIGYSARDYIQFWICAECSGTWPRWPESHPYFAWAETIRADYDAGGETKARVTGYAVHP